MAYRPRQGEVDDSRVATLSEQEDSDLSDGLEESMDDSEGAVVISRRDDFGVFEKKSIPPQPPSIFAKIRRWLQPTAYDDEGGEYRKHLASHLDGTGRWLFSSDVYRDWHSAQEHGLLWIRGIPGSGKSVFAASLIDQLKRDGCPVLYFFFRQIIAANHSPVAALRDWLDQLLVFSPPLQLKLKEYVDAGRPLESLSSADLWKHIRQTVLQLPRVYCVVDALDEMDRTGDLEPFLESLAEVGRWRPEKVKVCITNRPVAYIEGPLRMAKALHIRLEEHKVDIDIATFVQHKLDHSTVPKDSHDLIRKAVPGRANGLFLYAKLAMDAFLQPGADVHRVLRELPQDLNVMYADLLREHARRSSVPDDIQLLIMQSVTHTTRPLRLLELAELVDVTQHPTEKRDLKAAKDLVRSACGPLLEILPDETVSVVHHSLTEFLNGSTRQPDSTSYPILEPGPTHNRLAVICLSYLLSGGLDEAMPAVQTTFNPLLWPAKDRDIRDGREPVRLPPPLARYAVLNWPAHVRKAALAGHDQSDVNRLLDDFMTAETLKKWVSLSPGRSRRARNTPLFVAVGAGLPSYVRVLLSRPETDVNAGGENDGETPLTHAARSGYNEIVELLLKAGASTSRHTMRCGTPLWEAATHNHPEVIRLLVDAGDDPFGKITLHRDMVEHTGSRSVSPIMVACQYGHLDAMRAFLPHIKTPEQANAILSEAASENRPGIVEMILQHPLTEVNAKTKDHTPLFSACWRANAESVRLLLQAGADPNIFNREWGGSGLREGETALQVLAGPSRLSTKPEDEVECFKMLIAAGARVDLVDIKGNTALHHVQDPTIARLLLDAGADPNAMNRFGETILHTCRNDDLLQVLLEYADIGLEQKYKLTGFTLLLSALEKGKMQLAVRLLKLGAKGAAVDNQGNGVFHYAAARFANVGGSRDPLPNSPTVGEFKDLVRRLQESGGNIHLRNRDGQNALHVLAAGFRPHSSTALSQDVLSTLVAAGADLEARDNEGRTPLFYLVQHGMDPQRGFQNMLQEGAKPDTRDFQGRTLFHARFENHYGGGGVDRFGLLVRQGLDPHQTDYQGNTLWHIQVVDLSRRLTNLESPPSDYLQAIYNLGVSPTQPNNMGRTPLHLLSMFQPREFEEEFLQGHKYGTFCTRLQYMIQRHFRDDGVDQADNYGVTALHLASTHSEFNTRCLLEAGADPLKATRDGLTALHLAARSRQPNVLGLLLETLRSRTAPEVFSAAITAKDASHLFHMRGTPLHYACVSGETESVRLLLEAGASVDTEDEDKWYSRWYSFLGFEEEERNWPTSSYNPRDDFKQPDARAVLLDDKYRGKESKTLHRNESPRERLDEIMDLLASFSPPSVEVLDDAIARASHNNLDYTVECLSRIRKAISLEEPTKGHPYRTICLYRRAANRRAIDDTLRDVESPVERSRSKYSTLMKLRDYDAAADALIEGGGLQADAWGLATLHELAARGFASVLKKVATKEVIAKLDDWDVRQRLFEKVSFRWPELREPIFLVACQAEVPNMDVIRVLVEDIGVNINVQNVKWDYSSRNGRQFPKNEGALHQLVKGNQWLQENHWWQVAQAMPYLVQHGADIELRDGKGLTPLHRALDRIGLPSFNRRAVEALIALGADANAADAEGVTCLARASRDIGITKLLLERGAVVAYADLAAAIDGQRPHVLEVLLEHGGNPNAMRTAAEEEKAAAVAAQCPLAIMYYPTKEPGKLLPDELHPVDRAATGRDTYEKTTASRGQIVQMLLDHGADPNARYPQTGTTVMHRVIADGRYVQPFLALPSLDLELRDDAGCTLLLAACRANARNNGGHQSTSDAVAVTVQTLLDLGADVRARSASGMTALHSLVPTEGFYLFGSHHDLAALRRVALAAPDLVNTANDSGLTALHIAANRGPANAVVALLDAGADPCLCTPGGDTSLHFLLGGTWKVRTSTAAARTEKKKKGEEKQEEEEADVVQINEQALLERLLAGGADANGRNAAGETPLFAYFRHAEVDGEAFYAQGHPYTEEERWRVGDARVLALFEAVGMDFRAVNTAGESLLHVVAARGRGYDEVRRFRFLMGRGLDALREDVRQRTPLDVAATTGATRILELFGRQGEEEQTMAYDEEMA